MGYLKGSYKRTRSGARMSTSQLNAIGRAYSVKAYHEHIKELGKRGLTLQDFKDQAKYKTLGGYVKNVIKWDLRKENGVIMSFRDLEVKGVKSND